MARPITPLPPAPPRPGFVACYAWAAVKGCYVKADEVIHLRSRSNPMRSLCGLIHRHDLPFFPVARWGTGRYEYCRVCAARTEHDPEDRRHKHWDPAAVPPDVEGAA